MSEPIVDPRPSFFSRERTILAVFFAQAMAGGGIFTRIPDVQIALGLSEAELGLALMGQPVGALCSFLIAARIVALFGTRSLLMLGIPMIAISSVLIAIAPSAALVCAGFALFGTSFALCNVAMNVEADRVEAATGSRVMNRCHGMWSFGFLIAALLGAFARGWAVSPALHFALILPLILAGSLIFIRPMTLSAPRSHQGAARKRLFVLPTRATLLLVGFGIVGVMAEGGTRNWSVIYMRDSFDAPDLIDTLTLPAFLLMLTSGRMLADKWIEIYGPVRIASILIVTAIIGLFAVIAAQSLWQALLGFALMGTGISVIYPLTISAAARIGDREASENVAAITMITSIILLGAPALMGFIAESYGIRAAFAFLLPFFVLALALAPHIGPDKKES